VSFITVDGRNREEAGSEQFVQEKKIFKTAYLPTLSRGSRKGSLTLKGQGPNFSCWCGHSRMRPDHSRCWANTGLERSAWQRAPARIASRVLNIH
jgi:hypothetical protein